MCSARLLLVTLLALGAAHAAVLGIDVGANSYKAAVIRGGGIDVLLNDVSKRKTPTALAFHPDEGVFYGDAALTYALRAPDRAVTAVGLHLGRMGPHPPPLRASARGSAELPLATEGDSVPAEALASLLLSKVRAAGGNVRDVALSVPAWFGHSQRRALIDAAELAGFNVLALVNDGTALALAYATLRGEPSKAADAEADHVLIVDVGAYSSRATLATVRSVAVEGAKGKNRSVPLVSVLHHAWEENAAGDAIDALLAAHLRKQVPFPELSARAQAKLLREAKRVKEVLSANAHTVAQVEGLVDDWNLKAPVTRKELDALLEPLLLRLVAPVQRALAAANLSAAALAAVELVGGGGRVPAVQAALSAALGGRALDKHMNGDEALVEGAALFAASLSSGLRVREVRLRDGSPHALNAHLSLHPEADGEVAAREGGYTVALFKRGAKLGGRRTLKVAASDAFTVAIAYAEPEALARGVPAQVANFTVGGFEALKDAAGPVRVVLQFRLSLSGLVELERAHAELTEAVPAAAAAAPATEAPGAPDAKEGDKADDADDAKAPAGDANKDAAPAPAPTPAPEAAGGEKKRVRHVVLTTAAAAHGVQMSAADRKEAEAVLARLKARDDARKKREAAKNALEAEVYALRERLEEGATQACSTEAERAALAAAIAENAAWLDEAAASTTSAEFAAREKALRTLYAPVARRIAEEDARPRAVAAARAALGPLPKLLANVSATLNVTEEEVQEVLAEAAEALRWLDEAAAAQEQRARHEDGAFTSDEVAERARRIEKKARRLVTRPVRPPPSPSPSPAAATPEAGAAPEAAAAEEAREQEAIKEEKERVPEN